MIDDIDLKNIRKVRRIGYYFATLYTGATFMN